MDLTEGMPLAGVGTITDEMGLTRVGTVTDEMGSVDVGTFTEGLVKEGFLTEVSAAMDKNDQQTRC